MENLTFRLVVRQRRRLGTLGLGYREYILFIMDYFML